MKALKVPVIIEDKTWLMTFGMRFLEKIGEKYALEVEGGGKMRGLHYASILTEIQTRNPVIIFDMIRYSTLNIPQLTDEMIEDYVFTNIEEEESEAKLFDDFFDIFKKLPGAKKYAVASQKLVEQEEPSSEEEVQTKKTAKAKS